MDYNAQNSQIDNKQKSNEKNVDTCTRPAKPHWMLLLTPLAFITGWIAFQNGYMILAIAEWGLVLSSVIYWLKPACEYRRKFDIIVVQMSLYTHIIYSFIGNSMGSLLCYFIGVVSYLFGLHFDSNIMHSLVWIFGSIGNYTLITDLMNTFSEVIIHIPDIIREF